MSRRTIALVALGVIALATFGVLAARWAVTTREASLPQLPSSAVPPPWHTHRTAHGHMVHVERERIPCKKCHATEVGFDRPSMDVCAECHAARAEIRHAASVQPLGKLDTLADCTACHGFGPEQGDRKERCIDCHQLQQGRLAPVEQHADETCSECHKLHEHTSLQPTGCVSCHAFSSNDHGKHPPDSAQNCLECHDAHQPATLAAGRCSSCHDKPHALSRQAHQQCTACHVPHGFERQEVRACRSCHEDQHVLGEQRTQAHAQCKSCHDPHAPKSASERACKSCHAQVAPTHPAHEGRSCLGCHRVHEQTPNVLTAQPCTGCHLQAHADRGPQAAHGGNASCTDCHRPHAFAHPAVPGSCASCHAAQLTAAGTNRGHSTESCKGCHAGEVHAAQNPAKPCASCHHQVHTLPGHAECTGCHEPHSGAPLSLELGCQNCHKEQEHALAPEHKDCLTCHAPHQGSAPDRAQCTHCHTPMSTQNHAQLKGGCTECHKLHTKQSALSAPACTSCHDLRQLPGLHQAQAHSECGKCHEGAHDMGPFAERATCLSCHSAQQDHVPEARSCQGCHLFQN